MKKIIHFAKHLPTHKGGMETVTKEMALAGTEAGLQVEIIGLGEAPPITATEPGITYKPLESILNIGPIGLAKGYSSAIRALTPDDIIHIHMPHPVAELALFRNLDHITCKIIPVAHVGILRLRPFSCLWETIVQRSIIRKSPFVIAAAKENYDAFPSFQCPPDKKIVIPFGADDPGEITLAPKRTSKTLRILSVGRLVWYKGFDILIQALSIVSNEGHSFCHEIIGEGPEHNRLKLLIESLGLSEKVLLKGKLSEKDKKTRFRQTDWLAVPSISKAEAFGMVIVEGFSFAKPVLATDISTGMASLTRSGKCGRVVRAGKVQPLAEAIIAIIKEREQNGTTQELKIGAMNREFYSKNLTSSSFRKSYKNFISQFNLKE